MNTLRTLPVLILALVVLSCGAEAPAPVETVAADGLPATPGSAEICFAAMDEMEFPRGGPAAKTAHKTLPAAVQQRGRLGRAVQAPVFEAQAHQAIGAQPFGRTAGTELRPAVGA